MLITDIAAPPCAPTVARRGKLAAQTYAWTFGLGSRSLGGVGYCGPGRSYALEGRRVNEFQGLQPFQPTLHLLSSTIVSSRPDSWDRSLTRSRSLEMNHILQPAQNVGHRLSEVTALTTASAETRVTYANPGD